MNSFRYDYHLHSFFSADSETSPEDQIRQAIFLGLEGICFTEHEDPDYPKGEDDLDFSIDFPNYFKQLKILREKYKDQLDICIGMEFGIQEHLSDKLNYLSREYPLDFIIVSQHVLNGKDPYYLSYFEGRSEKECYEEFLQAQYENLQRLSPDSFDTLGHMDYIVRYGPNKNQYYTYQQYASYIDPILEYLIEHNKCLEINTGGLKYGLGETNPCTDVLKRYRELGGEHITIGSDAHEPRFLAYKFPETAALLRELGYSYYCVFKNRKMKKILF